MGDSRAGACRLEPRSGAARGLLRCEARGKAAALAKTQEELTKAQEATAGGLLFILFRWIHDLASGSAGACAVPRGHSHLPTETFGI